MAYTTINKSSEHFDTKVYTGNGTSQTLDMDNLGMLWMKNRTETSNHNLFDSVRGGYYTSAPGPNLRPNGTTAGHGSDITSAYGITFGSSSSTIGSDGGGYNYNQNGKSYVGWQWRANGTGSANTDGSISSTVSVNTTSGFSIVKWTSNDVTGATIGHGLGTVPSIVLIKNTSTAQDWIMYHKSLGNSNIVKLNSTDAINSGTGSFNGTTPTNSVFTVGSDNSTRGANGNVMIAYCFADVQGYSKFGSYTGNGNADGTFIYTGFKPQFILSKQSHAVRNWVMTDTKRSTYNISNNFLAPNLSDAEQAYTYYDILSNGFKARDTSTWINENGGTYIYMAFAAAPLVGTNGVTAKAR